MKTSWLAALGELWVNSEPGNAMAALFDFHMSLSETIQIQIPADCSFPSKSPYIDNCCIVIRTGRVMQGQLA